MKDFINELLDFPLRSNSFSDSLEIFEILMHEHTLIQLSCWQFYDVENRERKFDYNECTSMTATLNNNNKKEVYFIYLSKALFKFLT